MTRGRASAFALVAVLALAFSACALRHLGSGGGHARNVILFIGDGMGISAYTAARVWKVGASGRTAIDSLPHTALCSTYSYDYIVTDSAPSATSILCGVKARNDVIGEGPDAIPGLIDDPKSGHEGTPAKSILELAAARGLATGIVTTTTVTHATPASSYAHIRHRDMESDIALQLLEPKFGNPPPDVILGGGRRFFQPPSVVDPEYPEKKGERADGRDLTEELKARGYTYVWNGEQFATIEAQQGQRVLGLFEPSHMLFETLRQAAPLNEPSLVQMTERAIEILSRDPDGYFLLVEGGRIDHALHANNVEFALLETAMFDDAVKKAIEMTSESDTLILVTADHSHPLTINGYPLLDRNADGTENRDGSRASLLGSAGRDTNGHEYPTLSFAAGPGGISPRPKIADRPAMIPLEFGLHAGEDVLVAARGPGADQVHGFITNTQIFDIMRAAYGW